MKSCGDTENERLDSAGKLKDAIIMFCIGRVKAANYVSYRKFLTNDYMFADRLGAPSPFLVFEARQLRPLANNFTIVTLKFPLQKRNDRPTP